MVTPFQESAPKSIKKHTQLKNSIVNKMNTKKKNKEKKEEEQGVMYNVFANCEIMPCIVLRIIKICIALKQSVRTM